MKRHIILSIILSLALSAAAFDATTNVILRSIADREALASRSEVSEGLYVPLILQIDCDTVIDWLAKYDAIIYKQRADLLLTSIPRENLAEALSADGILNAATSQGKNSLMDRARPFAHADLAQQGSGLAHPYTGKGVITGFSDIGFDPSHIAFRGRIAALYDYDATHGKSTSATSPLQIAKWTTDTDNEYHATHVANIMTGACLESGYYGVAYGSEIVATTSRLTDVGILAGVEDIIQKSKEEEKPAVINLSLGSCLGPHDGTDLMCRYLALCGEDAIICLSAGNFGKRNISATHTFTPDAPVGRVSLMDGATWAGFKIEGITDIWGSDASTIEASIEVYDYTEQKIVYSSPWVGSEELPELLISADEDPEWAQYMNGRAYVDGGIDDLNGRFNISVLFETETKATTENGRWARYRDCIALRGANGNKIYVYADGSYTFLAAVAGMPSLRPSPDQSISNLCTAANVISVGMANSRNTAPNLAGGELEWDFSDNLISAYSSYGNAFDGTPLPYISGPGRMVVSAMSTPYYKAHPMTDLSASVEVYGKKYYYVAEGGTSMSSPFVAGAIALWLEANPELSVHDALDIATSTAITDYADIADPRWGAGCIDVYAGLKKAIEMASVASPTINPIVEVTADGKVVLDPSTEKIAKLYNLSGTQVRLNQCQPHGIYILQIPGFAPMKLRL